MFLRSGWEVNMLKPEADQVGDFVGVQLHSQDDVPWRPWQNFDIADHRPRVDRVFRAANLRPPSLWPTRSLEVNGRLGHES